MNSKYYIEALQMQRHPEGGYYKETFRSPLTLNFEGFEGPRSMATSILFLLEKGDTSAMHRIKSDEIWYHQDGACLIIMERDESGKLIETKLGKNLHKGEVLQYVVSAGRWFGARLDEGSDFALVGCQVSPGFDFRDFELEKKD